jgi:hypothetical protein
MDSAHIFTMALDANAASLFVPNGFGSFCTVAAPAQYGCVAVIKGS